MFEAMATVCEAVAQNEVTRVTLCVLSLDFQEAFDRTSHEYFSTFSEAMDVVTVLWKE
jgi:hypothetical protein